MTLRVHRLLQEVLVPRFDTLPTPGPRTPGLRRPTEFALACPAVPRARFRGCSSMARVPAFQAGHAGSIPVTRSNDRNPWQYWVPVFRVQATPRSGIGLHRAAIARDTPARSSFRGRAACDRKRTYPNVATADHRNEVVPEGVPEGIDVR